MKDLNILPSASTTASGNGGGRIAALPRVAESPPHVPLRALDQLWFQVSGTVCNLRCRHCFISCSPDNHSFWFMTRDQVAAALAESVPLGVK